MSETQTVPALDKFLALQPQLDCCAPHQAELVLVAVAVHESTQSTTCYAVHPFKHTGSCNDTDTAQRAWSFMETGRDWTWVEERWTFDYQHRQLGMVFQNLRRTVCLLADGTWYADSSCKVQAARVAYLRRSRWRPISSRSTLNEDLSSSLDAVCDIVRRGAAARVLALAWGTEVPAFSSAQILRVTVDEDDCGPAQLEAVRALFSAPHRYAFDTLKVDGASQDVKAFVTHFFSLDPPLPSLRFLEVEPSEERAALMWLADAVVAWPSLKRVNVLGTDPTDLFGASGFLVKHGYRKGDAGTPIELSSRVDSEPMLLRSAPRSHTPTTCAQPSCVENETVVVVRLVGIDSPPLRRDRLRFSSLLEALFDNTEGRAGGFATEAAAVEAVTGGALGAVLTLPSTYRNSDGDEELENRFSNVDVALAVLWLNEYACDEVHAKVTQDPSAYLVTGGGRQFFTHGVCKGGAAGPVSEARCHSVLAVAHYLRIATLEHLMVCLLASGIASGNDFA